MVDVAANLASIRARVAAAAARVGRSPEEITLIGVTKKVDTARIQTAVAAGLTDIGENYVQEARAKLPLLPSTVRRHFIGHLQRNKVNQALQLFDLIHTVDRTSLAEAIERKAGERRVDVLLQINIGEEASKSGADPEQTEELVCAAVALRHLRVCGLMIIPPFLPDPESVRPYFRALRELRDRLRETVPEAENLHELSMGMTHDFEVAIEEGATMIRVGTGLFGPRDST